MVTSGTAGAVAGPPSQSPTSATTRFVDAAVNLEPGEPTAGGWAGGVLFHREVGGSAGVEMWLSHEREVTCADGSQGIASTVLSVDPDVPSTPGPVFLEVTGDLRSATGTAVLDVQQSTTPGCGEDEQTQTLSALPVSIEVTGTSARFFSGFGGGVASGPDALRQLSYRFSRDGVGSLKIADFLDAESAAFIVRGVDRLRVHGTPPEIIGSPAPQNGLGAEAYAEWELQPPGGLGTVYQDAWLTATTTAPPRRQTTVALSSLSISLVPCPDGEQAEVVEYAEGSGPAQLRVGNRLGDASAAGTVSLERWTSGGCQEQESRLRAVVAASDPVDVGIDLTATGPLVRVRDVRWHVVPGEGGQVNQRGWYTARTASGTIAVARLTQDRAASGTIARSGP